MKLRTLIGAVAMSLAAAAFVFAAPRDDTRQLENAPAPAFELATLDGQRVKLDDLKGDVVVLDFWATWCGPCRAAMPHLQELANDKELADKGLRIFAVNLKEGEDKIRPFLEQNNYTFTVPMDTDGNVAKAYKVQGIPTQVVIGRDGKVKAVLVGFGDDSAQKLDAAIQEALKA